MGNKLFYLVVIGVVGILAILFFAVWSAQDDSVDFDESLNPYTDIEAENLHPETVKYIGNENYQYNVTPDAAQALVNDNDYALLYYWSPTCSHCIDATPLIHEARGNIDTDIPFAQVNLLEYGAYRETFGIVGTPTLSLYYKGREFNRVNGNPGDVEIFEQFLTESIEEIENFDFDELIENEKAHKVELEQRLDDGETLSDEEQQLLHIYQTMYDGVDTETEDETETE